MMEGVHADDAVKACVSKRQARAVSRDKSGTLPVTPGVQGETLMTDRQHLRVVIEGYRDISKPIEQFGDIAGTSTKVEDFIPGSQPQAFRHDHEIEEVTESRVVRLHAQGVAQGAFAEVGLFGIP